MAGRRRPSAAALAALAYAERAIDKKLTPPGRGGSWHRAGDPQQRATVRIWASRQEWATELRDWVTSEEATAARSAANGARGVQPVMGIERLLAVGLYLAAIASGDGRDITVSNPTIARRLAMGVRTVERARATLRRAGFEVVIARGGYLTRTERAQARAQHGGHQLRCASTASLTHPPTRLAGGLPRRGSSSNSKSTHKRVIQSGCAAAMTKKPRKIQPQPPIAYQRFAGLLAARITRLDLAWRSGTATSVNGMPTRTGTTAPGHIGQLARALHRLAPQLEAARINPGQTQDTARHAVNDLIDFLDRHARARHIDTAGNPNSPIAHFIATTRAALGTALIENWEPRSHRLTREATERATRLTRPAPTPPPAPTAADLQAEAEARALIRKQSQQALARTNHARYSRHPRPGTNHTND